MRAVLDIGTNSVRLLVAKVSGVKVEPMTMEVRVTRLGQGVAGSGYLSPEAMGRTLNAVSGLIALIPKGALVSILATSAVRDAANAEEFAQLIKEQTGISLQILSGQKEAELSFMGAALRLKHIGLAGPITVVDVGGGSTEIYTGTSKGELLGGGSAQIGAVRLLERYREDQLQARGTEVFAPLVPLMQENLKFKPQTLLAVGGTATSLAAIIQDLQEYNEDKITGYSLSLATLEDCYKKLGRLSLEERREIPSLQAGREDVIVYGAAILMQVMQLMGFSKLYVSSGGLLYGSLLTIDEH